MIPVEYSNRAINASCSKEDGGRDPADSVDLQGLSGPEHAKTSTKWPNFSRTGEQQASGTTNRLVTVTGPMTSVHMAPLGGGGVLCKGNSGHRGWKRRLVLQRQDPFCIFCTVSRWQPVSYMHLVKNGGEHEVPSQEPQ